MAGKATGKKATFEDKLAAMEAIIRALEEGSLPLEESLRRYEEGVRLSRELEQELESAQQRLTVLRQDGDGFHEEPLTLDTQGAAHDSED